MKICKICSHWQNLDATIGYCNCCTSKLYAKVLVKKHISCDQFKEIDRAKLEQEDNALRKLISQDPYNGYFATIICRKCHSFWTSPDGDWKTAKIVDQCKDCQINYQ